MAHAEHRRTTSGRAADRSPPTSAGWTRSTRSRSATTTTRDNTHFGLLLVNNDDVVAPGQRLRDPPAPGHGDRHLGAARRSWCTRTRRATTALIYPGLAQRMSAGTGILHSREERQLAADRRRRAHGPGATSCRCGCCPTRAASSPATSSWTSTTSCSAAAWCRSRVGHGRARGRRRDPDRPARRRAARRAARRRRDRDAPGRAVRAPLRRRGAVELEGAGPLGTGDAVRHHRRRRPAGHRRPEPAPRSWSGRCTPAWPADPPLSTA